MIERVVTDTLRDVGTSGAGVLPPLFDIRLTHVAGANHQLHVWNGQVRGGSAQHPRRGIILVLVDALIEVDLVEVAQKGKAMQGNSPLRAPFLDVFLELHLQPQYRPMDRSAPVNWSSAAMTASAALRARVPLLRSSTARIPAACAPPTSCTSLSPTITVPEAPVPSACRAALKIAGDGLRQPISAENVTASRWVSRPTWASCACSERTRYGAFEQRPTRTPSRRSASSNGAAAGSTCAPCHHASCSMRSSSSSRLSSRSNPASA